MFDSCNEEVTAVSLDLLVMSNPIVLLLSIPLDEGSTATPVVVTTGDAIGSTVLVWVIATASVVAVD